jgi:2-polyprenyl-3-methyl-5-hydroxy-6-metoxy-1,4-benzoquinol methylase
MQHAYPDIVRHDVLRLIPLDGISIGSVGCSCGGTEAELVKAGRQVHGVDISQPAIDIARTRLTTARCVRPDDDHPFEDESLDGLILADVIEHIPAAWKYLKSCVRAVKPGGWVVISVPNMRNIDTIRQFWFKGDWPEHQFGLFDATHVQVMSKKRLERWCLDAGLTVEFWQKSHNPRRPMRSILNALTLGMAWPWFMYQLQGRFRKAKSPLSYQQGVAPQ